VTSDLILQTTFESDLSRAIWLLDIPDEIVLRIRPDGDSIELSATNTRTGLYTVAVVEPALARYALPEIVESLVGLIQD
jgi:hypothetical protein